MIEMQEVGSWYVVVWNLTVKEQVGSVKAIRKQSLPSDECEVD